VISKALHPRRTRWGFAWVAVRIVLAPAIAHAQGVHIGLLPRQQYVSPGGGFDVQLWVTEAGAAFNGFDAVVSYDPGALTFQQATPTSQQQGPYMTGACGNTFHLFHAAGDSLSITEVLLCNGVLLPGPGELYTLHFVASLEPQITHVHIRSAAFYAAGINVEPVTTADDTIGIGIQLDAGDSPAPRTPRLSAMPNPSRGTTELRLEMPAPAAGALVVCDVLGRTVRHLEHGSFTSGARTIRWDGRDDRGRRLEAGVYLVQLRSAAGAVGTRVTLLP
jgi:hypothetical protein